MTSQGWLAQTFAVPAIGIQTHPWLGFAPGVWTTLEKLGKQWSNEAAIHSNSAVAVRVVRSNGIYFDLSPTTITCGFTYQLAMRQRPGGAPELVTPKDVKAFPDLMSEVVDELRALIEISASVSQGRAVQRIGCVADCRIAEDKAPPGVTALVTHLGRPWPGRLKAAESSLLIEMSETAAYRDQCHHVVSLNAYDRPNDLGFKLDWQRVWPGVPTMQGTELKTAVAAVRDVALQYFQAFGEGGWEG